jgi:hypothetical protein
MKPPLILVLSQTNNTLHSRLFFFFRIHFNVILPYTYNISSGRYPSGFKL